MNEVEWKRKIDASIGRDPAAMPTLIGDTPRAYRGLVRHGTRTVMRMDSVGGFGILDLQ